MDKYERAQQRVALGKWIVDADRGRVYNRSGRRIGSQMTSGYTFLVMRADGENGTIGNRNAYAHRVIWESVHGRIPDGLQINHKNGIKSDNRISNLEVVTPSENTRHAYRTGLVLDPGGHQRRRAA